MSRIHLPSLNLKMAEANKRTQVNTFDSTNIYKILRFLDSLRRRRWVKLWDGKFNR